MLTTPADAPTLFGMPLKEAVIKGLTQDAFSIMEVSYAAESKGNSTLDLRLAVLNSPTPVKEVSGTGYAREMPEMKFREVPPPGSICPICAGLGCDPCHWEGVVPDKGYDPYPSPGRSWEEWAKGIVSQGATVPTKPVGWEGVPTGGDSSRTTLEIDDDPTSFGGEKNVSLTHRLHNGQKIRATTKVSTHAAADAHNFADVLVQQLVRKIGEEYAKEFVGPQISMTRQQVVDQLAGLA
jgi:hypothetical protein